MAYLLSQRGNAAYGVKNFIVKTTAEIKDIELGNTTMPGSKVYVTTTGATYILDPDRIWTLIPSGGGGSGDETIPAWEQMS